MHRIKNNVCPHQFYIQSRIVIKYHRSPIHVVFFFSPLFSVERAPDEQKRVKLCTNQKRKTNNKIERKKKKGKERKKTIV